MAMLHELIKPGVPAKLKRKNADYCWDGHVLWLGSSISTANEVILLSDEWQLDEPTVEDVLKERGYECSGDKKSWFYISRKEAITQHMLSCKFPTTAAEMTRIIDFLESLNK